MAIIKKTIEIQVHPLLINLSDMSSEKAKEINNQFLRIKSESKKDMDICDYAVVEKGIILMVTGNLGVCGDFLLENFENSRFITDNEFLNLESIEIIKYSNLNDDLSCAFS